MAALTVEIPTYNEAANLPLLVEQLEQLPIDMEIVVIDDSSPDGTGEIAKALALKYGNVRVLERPSKAGLASAIFDGLSLVTTPFVAVMDCDLQHPADALPRMLDEAQRGADIVIASRYVRGGHSSQGIFRYALSKGATLLAHLLIPETRKIRDPLSGFFLFRKELLTSHVLAGKGYKLLLMLLARCRRCNVAEIPYSFGRRRMGKSKLGPREMVNYLSLLLKLSDYRLLKFSAVGAAGAVLNEFLLYMLEPHLQLLMASGAAVEASIISNFAMNNFWTFSRKRNGSLLRRFFGYQAVAMFGAATNVAILGLLVLMHFEYLAANFVGISLGFAANYLGSEHVVWSYS